MKEYTHKYRDKNKLAILGVSNLGTFSGTFWIERIRGLDLCTLFKLYKQWNWLVMSMLGMTTREPGMKKNFIEF